ncbi:hypothetical protein D2C78_00865 [Helicobacter pylori]|nr:hypothetical protein D2C78_00865 [Helicobacter pylori]
MWNERFLKVIPAVVFLFCLLDIFEMVLIINDMNKTAKLETAIMNNLKVLEDITISLNRYSECMQLEHFKFEKNEIK